MKSRLCFHEMKAVTMLIYFCAQATAACPCPSRAPARLTLSAMITRTARAASPTSPPSQATTSSTSSSLTSMCQVGSGSFQLCSGKLQSADFDESKNNKTLFSQFMQQCQVIFFC